MVRIITTKLVQQERTDNDIPTDFPPICDKGQQQRGCLVLISVNTTGPGDTR